MEASDEGVPVDTPLFDFDLEPLDEPTSKEVENPRYLAKQLVTYIGNKRLLFPSINELVIQIKSRLGNKQLIALDLFSGSGGVARLLKQHSEVVITNDLETYSTVLNDCFLTNWSDIDMRELRSIVDRLNDRADRGDFSPGFIRDLYAPMDEQNIDKEDRVFYTVENALRLDSFAQWIAQEPMEYRNLLLGPLMSKASVHANTSGVFKGFYKDVNTGAGSFGGTGKNALARILGQIRLEVPVLSNFDAAKDIRQGDAVSLAGELPEVDIAYLDPPYNQHPYGANYFMLNYLHDYRAPEEVSKVSGIPTNWNRSDFNVKKKALDSLKATIEPLKAKFVLLSFNDEGFVSPLELREFLSQHGKLTEAAIEYNTFRGSRNLAGRSDKVTEHLFLLERG